MSTGVYYTACTSTECTGGTKLSRCTLQHNCANMMNLCGVFHWFFFFFSFNFCRTNLFQVCSSQNGFKNITISSVCPVTMVFRPRLSHSMFLTVCVFFQACIVCWAHLPWLFSNNPCPLQRETQPKLICSSFIVTAEACTLWVVPSRSTCPPTLLSLGSNEWWDRVRGANKNLFCKQFCVRACIRACVRVSMTKKSWKNIIMLTYCNKRLWTLITGGTGYFRKHSVSALYSETPTYCTCVES